MFRGHATGTRSSSSLRNPQNFQEDLFTQLKRDLRNVVGDLSGQWFPNLWRSLGMVGQAFATFHSSLVPNPHPPTLEATARTISKLWKSVPRPYSVTGPQPLTLQSHRGSVRPFQERGGAFMMHALLLKMGTKSISSKNPSLMAGVT